MRLKLIERTDGTKTRTSIVHAETGEPIEGVIGYGILAENGVRFLQVKVAGFEHERDDATSIVTAQQIPRLNGER